MDQFFLYTFVNTLSVILCLNYHLRTAYFHFDDDYIENDDTI
jgi:hypothetical protein